MRALCGVAAGLFLAIAGCDAATPQMTPLTVDPAETTEDAVRADVFAALDERLDAEDAAVLEKVLLVWEVRQLDQREAPSDLALVWARFTRSGAEGWALGQLFRHRMGLDVSWQWYVASDPAWLELFAYDHPPNAADVDAFLAHWDFEAEGINGALVGATIFEAAWTTAIGAPPHVAYPDGTPAP